MTDQADRLQAVAKARCNAMHFDRIDYAPCSDCRAYVRAKFAMSDADAAWREKRGTPIAALRQEIGNFVPCQWCPSDACRIAGMCAHDYVPQPPSAPEGDVERLANLVHEAYLESSKRLGWGIKPKFDVLYEQLPEDAKEVDRAAVRAVLSGLSPAPQQARSAEIRCNLCRHLVNVAGDKCPRTICTGIGVSEDKARSEDEELGRLLREIPGVSLIEVSRGRWGARQWLNDWSNAASPLAALQSALAAKR